MMFFFRFTSVAWAALVCRPCGTGPASGGYDVASSGKDDSYGGIGATAGGTQQGGTGMFPGSSQCAFSTGLAPVPDRNLVSAAGRDFQHTFCPSRSRGHPDSMERSMKGDLNIGRGCRQGSWLQLVAIHTRWQNLEEDDNHQLQSAIWTLSGLRLVCHCGVQQPCHADILNPAYSRAFPDAFDRNEASPPPTSNQLNHLAEVREEHDSSEGSTADEDSRPSGVRMDRSRKADASRHGSDRP